MNEKSLKKGLAAGPLRSLGVSEQVVRRESDKKAFASVPSHPDSLMINKSLDEQFQAQTTQRKRHKAPTFVSSYSVAEESRQNQMYVQPQCNMGVGNVGKYL